MANGTDNLENCLAFCYNKNAFTLCHGLGIYLGEMKPCVYMNTYLFVSICSCFIDYYKKQKIVQQF
jgi:hypothetical protein